MKKNGIRALALAACVVFSLGGCGLKPDEENKIVLNEVAHSVFYAPMYVALEKGYFEEQGIKVELVTGFGADKTMAAVLSGEADIGFMGSESTIYTYNGGVSDYVVNFGQLTQRAGNFLVSRKPCDSFEWDMLRNATVLGGRTGGMPEMVFEYVLKQHGLNPEKDLNIDKSIDFGSTAAAFAGGQGDYTIEFEPYATKLEQQKEGYVVASLGEESGYIPYTSFCAKSSYLRENPKKVQAFVNAIQKGLDYVGEHAPAEVAECIAPAFPETDLNTLTMIITRYDEQDTWKTNLIFEKNGFDLLQNILEDFGVLKERVEYDKLVNTEFAEKAAE